MAAASVGSGRLKLDFRVEWKVEQDFEKEKRRKWQSKKVGVIKMKGEKPICVTQNIPEKPEVRVQSAKPTVGVLTHP